MNPDTSPWTGYTPDNGGTWNTGYTWDNNPYPACGIRWGDHDAGKLYFVGDFGGHWSASPNSSYALSLFFYNGAVNVAGSYYYRVNGFSVRCVQES
jgi:hypothetical protein